MLRPNFSINDFGCLAMRASNNCLGIIYSLIHSAIVNEDYFSIVSISASHLIRCAWAPERLAHKILISNLGDQLIHLIAIYR
jgi:hypothetical protein